MLGLLRRRPWVPFIPEFRENVLLIQAFPRKRTMTVTYAGATKRVAFSDQTIRNMLAGRRFEANAESFVKAVAHALKQLIEP